jgi:hypothetical protein
MPDQIASDVDFNFEHVIVDAETRTLRNVVLCGPTSKNGYNYPPSCFGDNQHVIALYENKPVCIDHNSENPLVRGLRDIAGFIKNVRFENGRPVGDIELESAIDCGVDLLGLAQRKRKGIGMSHVAKCKMSRDKRTVELVEQVVTVDVVVNPATTSTFFEQALQETSKVDLETLKAELDSTKARYAVLESDLTRANELIGQHKSENDKLLTEVTSLRSEISAIKPAYEQYLSEQKKAADVAEIEKLLKEAELDLADKVVVSENFMNILLATAPEKRSEIISDRKALVGAKAPATGVRSPERKVNTEATEFKASEYINQNLGGGK